MSEKNKFSEGYRQEALELLAAVEESILEIKETREKNGKPGAGTIFPQPPISEPMS